VDGPRGTPLNGADLPRHGGLRCKEWGVATDLEEIVVESGLCWTCCPTDRGFIRQKKKELSSLVDFLAIRYGRNPSQPI
jgi:hypothetical protein